MKATLPSTSSISSKSSSGPSVRWISSSWEAPITPGRTRYPPRIRTTIFKKFFAHPSIVYKLQKALSDYRVRLSDMTVHYTFASIRDYHRACMNVRKNSGQDDPIGWSTKNDECSDLLVRKPPPVPNTKPNAQPSKSSSSGVLTCHTFNNTGRCTREGCRWSHLPTPTRFRWVIESPRPRRIDSSIQAPRRRRRCCLYPKDSHISLLILLILICRDKALC